MKPHPAKWWHKNQNEKIICTLCPRLCTLGDGQNGFCYIRQNIDGELYSLGYGHPTGFGVDPIEKKPLFHFLPDTKILSFGTAGCNLGCKFCQNWTMSKAKTNEVNQLSCSPEDVVNIALKFKVPSIAYTYNDPVIFGEYVIDISKIARERNIKSVMVTAGYIDKDARKEVFQFIDGANVDLKSFSEEFYFKQTGGHLADVLDTLVWLKNETAVWLEITTLLITGLNDSDDELNRMCQWIVEKLGDRVPLHFTAFHPDFKMNHIPATPLSTLMRARKIALSHGIKYCYLGNTHDLEGQTTYCPKCNSKLIERNWHEVMSITLKHGYCHNCGTLVDGVFV